MDKSKRALFLGALFLIALGGVFFLMRGLHHSEGESAPMVEKPFEFAHVPETNSTSAPEMDPRTIAIPSLKVTAPWSEVELSSTDAMPLPEDLLRVSLWKTPKETWIAGHINFNGRSGVLSSLASLKPGAKVWLSDEDGRVSLYGVRSLKNIPKAPLDGEKLGAKPGDVILVTCGGRIIQAFNSSGRSYYTYEDNVVAIASPLPLD